VPIQNVAIPCDDGIQKTTLGNDVLLKLLFFLKLQRRNFALELRVNFKLAQFHVDSPFQSFLIYGQWAERSSQTHIVSGNTLDELPGVGSAKPDALCVQKCPSADGAQSCQGGFIHLFCGLAVHLRTPFR